MVVLVHTSSSYIGRIPDRGNMNVRGNILIIWQGGSPISKHPHFDTQSPSPLPAFPPCPPASHPSFYPPVSSSHLTPSVSQGPIKSPLPPSPQHLSLSPSLSLKCHLHFSVHILAVEFPADGLIFLAIATTSAAHCAPCGGGWWGLNLCPCLYYFLFVCLFDLGFLFVLFWAFLPVFCYTVLLCRGLNVIIIWKNNWQQPSLF